MCIALIVALVISIALMIASMMLRPKPHYDTPQAMSTPTATAGKEIPVIFGSILIKDPNCLWWGSKSIYTYKKKMSKK